MNRETLNRIYDDELTPRQKKVLSLYLNGESDDTIRQALEANDRTIVTQHLRNISKKFLIFPVKDTDYRNTLVELFWRYKPEIVSPERLKKSGIIGGKPSYPDSPVRADSPFYIERSPIEAKCYNAIADIGTLLRISSPQKMGKTSLIKQIVREAKQKKYQTVTLDLSLIETEKFASTESFLSSFYQYIVQELSSVPPLKEWTPGTAIILNCTASFENLLRHLDGVLVLIIDEVDKIFEYPHIYQDFFPMLRHWYQQTNESEIWQKIRLVIAYATDDYGRLDLRQSPFNVGMPVQLDELNRSQVETLAYRHGMGQETVTPLIDLVRGHPYLLRLAFYHLYYEETTLSQLLQEAPTDTGIYKNHLLDLLERLEKQPDLKTAFKQILDQVNSPIPPVTTRQMYQLMGMGLIRFENNTAKVRSKLYQLYFCDRL